MKKSEAFTQIYQNLKKNEPRGSYCSICLTIASSPNQLKYHLKSNYHKNNLEKYIKYFVYGSHLNDRIFHMNLIPSKQNSIIELNRDLQDVFVILKNTSNFDFIKYEYQRNKILFKNCIQFIRSIKKLSIYTPNIEIDNTFNKLMEHNFLNQYVAKNILGDGNCFYRAISYQLFNNEGFYELIKACLIYLLIENESSFNKYLKDACQLRIGNIF